MALYNTTLDLYWFVKTFMGKNLTERGEAYGDLQGKLYKIYYKLIPLRYIPYQLNFIEPKKTLLDR